MSESTTQTELGQVLEAIKSMQSDIQAMDKKLDIHIATTVEKFNTVQAEIKAVRVEIKALDDKVDSLRSELRDDINELRSQQRTIDARLWGFIVALVTLVGGSVIKVFWFDRT
ncbi:hypothetical protein RYO59_002560 [Thermosynechococcaceae cyanobacterium Okahandja]